MTLKTLAQRKSLFSSLFEQWEFHAVLKWPG